MEVYDVIVVGGGPAGIPAAEHSAKFGAKTLLIERNEAIVARKACGEATGAGTFEDLGVKPKPHILIHSVFPRVYAPNGRYISLSDTKTYIINKTAYLQELALRAAEEGVDIHVKEEVTGLILKDGYYLVKTIAGEYAAKIVIGADGYNSQVARSLGINEKSEPVFTAAYLLANVKLEEPEVAKFYVGNKVAPKGYAWVFPKGEKIVEVGIGVRRGNPLDYLNAFLRSQGEAFSKAKIIGVKGAPVPVGGLISRNIGDGYILIGDAAGTVIPLTGAGIRSSGVAGKVAGKVAAECIQLGDTSAKCLGRWREGYKEWINKINTSLRVMRFLENLTDEELNSLAEVLEKDDVVKLAYGVDVKSVAIRLLKHPGIAFKLAKTLLNL